MRGTVFPLFIILLTFIFATCKKDAQPDQTNVYFQCKINGQTYIPDGCTNCVTCTILGDTAFLLGGNAGFQTLGIGVTDLTHIKIGIYVLSNNTNNEGDYKNGTILNDRYFTDVSHPGQMEITALDKTKKIISGVFHFKAYNAYQNDSVTVSDGKFRWNYTTN